MSIYVPGPRPAFRRVGLPPRRRLGAVVALGFVGLSLWALCPGRARAETGDEIYQKMQAVYAGAKTFQGVLIRKKTLPGPDGKSTTQTTTLELKFKAPDKWVMKNTVAGPGVPGGTVIEVMVSDGKTVIVSAAASKSYQKLPLKPIALSQFVSVLNPKDGVSLLPGTTVDGRPAYVLSPNLPKDLTPEQKAGVKGVKAALTIDKQNYHFIQMTVSGPKGSQEHVLSAQTLDGPLPDSLFVPTPPAGFKEEKPPGGAGSPGGPGGAGGPSHR